MMNNKKKRIVATLILVIAVLGTAIAKERVADKSLREFLEEYNPMQEKTLQAYNDEDWKKFYKYFSSSRHARTERTFNSIWMEDYKTKYGKFVSKTLIPEQCKVKSTYPIIVYSAKFENDDTTDVKFSYIREGDKYRIFSLRIDDVREGQKNTMSIEEFKEELRRSRE